jgi:hypothetical protein
MDFAALASRMAAGLEGVRACLIVSGDGLSLGAYPEKGEPVARGVWERLSAVGDPQRGFMHVGDELWVVARRGWYAALLIASPTVKAGLALDRLESYLRTAEEARIREAAELSGMRPSTPEVSRRLRTPLHREPKPVPPPHPPAPTAPRRPVTPVPPAADSPPQQGSVRQPPAPQPPQPPHPPQPTPPQPTLQQQPPPPQPAAPPQAAPQQPPRFPQPPQPSPRPVARQPLPVPQTSPPPPPRAEPAVNPPAPEPPPVARPEPEHEAPRPQTAAAAPDLRTVRAEPSSPQTGSSDAEATLAAETSAEAGPKLTPERPPPGQVVVDMTRAEGYRSDAVSERHPAPADEARARPAEAEALRRPPEPTAPPPSAAPRPEAVEAGAEETLEDVKDGNGEAEVDKVALTREFSQLFGGDERDGG